MKYIFLVAITIQITLADPVAVTWTTQPVILSEQCIGCNSYGVDPNAYQIDNGLNAGQEIDLGEASYGANPGFSATVAASFTIAAPADIALSVNASYASYGTSCGDGGCNSNLASWELDGGFSGSVSIVGANEIVAGMVNFAASGAQAAQCDVGMQCTVGYSSQALTLTATGLDEVFLQAGTYQVLTNYLNWNESAGDSGTQAHVIETVSDPPYAPVPEPSVLGAILAALVATGALLYVHEKLRRM